MWYPLGLTYYLLDDHEKAINAYEKCIYTWDINDNYVSIANWYYQSLRFLGRDDEAEKLLEKAEVGMDVVENMSYLKLLLMYKGEIQLGDLLNESREAGGFDLVAIGYGIAAWYLLNDEKEKAVKTLKEILSVKGWAGFGLIAAEATYKRLGLRP